MSAYSHLGRPESPTAANNSYVLNDTKWGPQRLGTPPAAPITYAFSDGRDGTGLSGDDTSPQSTIRITDMVYQQAVQRAFEDWEAVADVQFARMADGSDADIDLYFVDIDGAGSTLGQAYRTYTTDSGPGTIETILSSEIEFDTYEMDGADSQFFYLVAVHEVGHALGLDHVDDPTQIMYRFYDEDFTGPGDGDIAGMQALYGPSASFRSANQFGDATDDRIDTRAQTEDAQLFGNSGDDQLFSGSGDDMLLGGIGNDYSQAGDGRDMILDAFGNDTLQGEGGDDSIYSPQGNNRLDGGDGDDAVWGGIGNDNLIGGDGNDALIADDRTASSLWFGDDTLTGGTGNDSLEGGSGQDVFVFAPDEGTDQIGRITFSEQTGFSILTDRADFKPGEDKLDVRAFNFSSETDVMNALSSAADGALFSAAQTEVLITGVTVEGLTIEDFVW